MAKSRVHYKSMKGKYRKCFYDPLLWHILLDLFVVVIVAEDDVAVAVPSNLHLRFATILVTKF